MSRCFAYLPRRIQENAQKDKSPVMLASAPMVRDDLERPIFAGTRGVLSKPIDVILGTPERKSSEHVGFALATKQAEAWMLL